jgi:hypothetical protein
MGKAVGYCEAKLEVKVGAMPSVSPVGRLQICSIFAYQTIGLCSHQAEGCYITQLVEQRKRQAHLA